MQPYYQDHLSTIYLGDCREVLPQLAGSVDLIVTDPPYGVEIVGGPHAIPASRRRKAGKHTISNDDLGMDGTQDLVAAAMRLAPLRNGGSYYVCAPSGNYLPAFYNALEQIGMEVRQLLVWVKDVMVLGRQDYHWRHEAVLYGWRGGAPHAFYGGRNQDTVWEAKRPYRSPDHPTMKPLAVLDRAIWNSSKPGEVVLDPFLGSGSTLVAARNLGRRGIGIEIEEKYAEVAAKRCGQQHLGLDFNVGITADPAPDLLDELF